jgi:hypothetical protein
MNATLEAYLPPIQSHDAARLSRATQPLVALLRQLRSVIEKLTDGQYTQKPVGVVPSSVGGHVRHCLDHVRALLSATETGELNYDLRRRGTPVESSRCCALSEIDELCAELRSLRSDVFDCSLVMSVMMNCDAEPIDVWTTVGREMAFTLSHTIHHNALVAAMVKTLGGWLPERFGYAPSTPRSRDESACAR